MTEGGLPPEPHSDDLTLLHTTLDAVLATDLDCLPVGELLARACTLQTLSARIDAARAATLAAADTATDAPAVLRELGFRNAPQVVAAETGAPAREVHATARTGRWLNHFPVFAEAAAGGVLTLRHLRELKGLDTAHRRDALLASQHELVTAARDHDFVEFTNRITVWLINHSTADDVKEQVKKTSCTWNTNTDGSIDGRFHLDPLSAAAVGTALGDEMQRLFRQQSEGDSNPETPNRRRGLALVGLIVGGAETPGSATTTPLVNLVIGQKILENLLERYLDPDTVWPCFASPTRVCRPANSPRQTGQIRRRLPKANSGLPGNARQTIDMSVKTRGFPDWMKRALLITARGRCRTRGCDAVWPCFASPTRVCRPANSPRQTGQIRRRLPKANSGLPGNARQNCDPRQQVEARSRSLTGSTSAPPPHPQLDNPIGPGRPGNRPNPWTDCEDHGWGSATCAGLCVGGPVVTRTLIGVGAFNGTCPVGPPAPARPERLA